MCERTSGISRRFCDASCDSIEVADKISGLYFKAQRVAAAFVGESDS